MEQNAMIATTTIREEDDKTMLNYIPIHLDGEMLEYIFKHGKCDNDMVVYYELDCDQDTFWKDMWSQMMENGEEVK